MEGSNGDQGGSYAEPSPADPSKEVPNKPTGYGDSAATNHISGATQLPMMNGNSSSSSSGTPKEHKSQSSHGDKHKSSSSHHHSSSSKSKHGSSSSKDPSKHSSGSSSRDPSKHSSSSSKDPSKHSSSSSKDPSKHSSSSSKDPSKHSSSSSKHSSSHKSHSSSKDPSKSSSSHRHSSSHSSSKHHSSSSGDKKHHSSSSSGEKKHSSSSGDKHKSSSSGEKHKSSSSSDKHKSSSSSSDKHKSSSSSDKVKSSPNTDLKHKPSSSGEHPKSVPDGITVKKEFDAKIKPIKTDVKEESEFKMKAEAISPLKVSIKKEVTKPPKLHMEESDDDMPLTARVEAVKEEVRSPTSRNAKRQAIVESDDDAPLSARKEQAKKVKKEVKKEKAPEKRKRELDDDGPKKKKKKVPTSTTKPGASPTKRKKKEEVQEDKWKWWEEGPRDSGTKWNTLEHAGPVLAPDYEPLPSNVRFYYDKKEMKLSDGAEEVAGFYARMLDHDYTTKEVFNKNFFKDWRKTMTSDEKSKLSDLKKCNFRELHAFFMEESEKRKNRTKDEKLALKKQNQDIMDEYGWCIIDGHKQKIGNFRIEPPGLFRGRGDHPKQGMLKTRTMPEDVIINCSKNVEPPKPPKGHRWKEVRHDNTVTWLACWQENVQGSTKYVMLNAASRLKGEKDWMKYETARNLHKLVDKIRAQYHEDWKSKEMRIRQRAVALYFIDKLALRAGNEKDEDTADTVGCCSLRVEHLTLHEELGGKHYVVEFDFLGKDSIRYYNSVPVEKRVFKNLQLFVDNKAPGDDVFDRLNTSILNKHLQSLMDGLTAKVFRTFNASKTLQEQLDLLTNADDNVPAKMLSYNRANRAVAVLCNHQRAAPKNFSKQMENLQNKIEAKKDQIKEAKRDVKSLKADLKATKSVKSKTMLEKKKKSIERLEDQLIKLEVSATDKDENKEIALGTSKLNYLDPRISVAWCKKFDVPVEKVYNKTQREKFAWAIDMVDEDYVF